MLSRLLRSVSHLLNIITDCVEVIADQILHLPISDLLVLHQLRIWLITTYPVILNVLFLSCITVKPQCMDME